MDRQNVTLDEGDSLSTLAESFSKSLIVPILSKSTTTPKIIDLTESSQVTIAGLEVPKYTLGFFGLAFEVTYENFVVRLTELNPKTLSRPAAEEAWLTLIHQAYREWHPHLALYDDQKKKNLRKKATAQIHGKGLKGFDVEQFWGKKESGYSLAEVVARKKRKSDEMVNMNGVDYADRWEKRRKWRAVKHVKIVSSLTPQITHNSADTEETMGSAIMEPKFEQKDEDMEI